MLAAAAEAPEPVQLPQPAGGSRTGRGCVRVCVYRYSNASDSCCCSCSSCGTCTCEGALLQAFSLPRSAFPRPLASTPSPISPYLPTPSAQPHTCCAKWRASLLTCSICHLIVVLNPIPYFFSTLPSAGFQPGCVHCAVGPHLPQAEGLLEGARSCIASRQEAAGIRPVRQRPRQQLRRTSLCQPASLGHCELTCPGSGTCTWLSISNSIRAAAFPCRSRLRATALACCGPRCCSCGTWTCRTAASRTRGCSRCVSVSVLVCISDVLVCIAAAAAAAALRRHCGHVGYIRTFTTR